MKPAIQNLQICIIGAGIGGLTTGLALVKQGFQNVWVYENAPALGFVGAGIQMAPNMARILKGLGVWDEIAADGIATDYYSIREGASGKIMGLVDCRNLETEYGTRQTGGHRATLVNSLYDACVRNGVQFSFSSTVDAVDFMGRPTFSVTNTGEEKSYQMQCDILIGADGVKSKTRQSLLKELNVEAGVKETGQAAYRIMLTREQMQHDPAILALLDGDQTIRWIGEKRHIVAYPISQRSIYNISTTQPDVNFAAAASATYTTKGSKKAMMDVYGDFCPLVLRMLDLAPDEEIVEWKLNVHDPLPTWVLGSFALVGDACHPTLPHLGQGAAQAVEDGAVLSIFLAALPDASHENINKALMAYQEARKQRAETLVALAAESSRELHLGAGKAREERDRAFAAIKTGTPGKVPDKVMDIDVHKMTYGFDCMQDAQDKIATVFI
ncbi:FAD/NAD(P)-binding domain-containing protein [Aspergillus eucalypticola CBS 122712]|uniref:FAD/NAD(P)-binding domain-containing protein n=1 Tax=Aspergillus eucalypticola (strain CBS 122712 / IBT 29274) TaxID=1448314 RepID=A0A317WD57_ASPEC|nr:FAD/NAD(P)-binding domain-containing protein [Aspergillus eucalypticola CBS 122712]PWY84384.1 FAD/NAD(P)-binding domain-containing protein [Aspergillus eucalypticola CBS 122712]